MRLFEIFIDNIHLNIN